MRYLIVSERGNDGKLLLAMRLGSRAFDFTAMRDAIRSVFPNREAYSPLETAPREAEYLTLWISPDKTGVGRIEDRFYEWALDGKDRETV